MFQKLTEQEQFVLRELTNSIDGNQTINYLKERFRNHFDRARLDSRLISLSKKALVFLLEDELGDTDFASINQDILFKIQKITGNQPKKESEDALSDFDKYYSNWAIPNFIKETLLGIPLSEKISIKRKCFGLKCWKNRGDAYTKGTGHHLFNLCQPHSYRN